MARKQGRLVGSHKKNLPRSTMGRYRGKNRWPAVQPYGRTMSTRSMVGRRALYRRGRNGRWSARACRPRRRPVNSGCRPLSPPPLPSAEPRAPRLVCTYLPILKANRTQPRSPHYRAYRDVKTIAVGVKRPSRVALNPRLSLKATRVAERPILPLDGDKMRVVGALARGVVDVGEIVGELDETASDRDDHCRWWGDDCCHIVIW